MLRSWKDEAYLIYHVFAGEEVMNVSAAYSTADTNAAKGHTLSSVARLSEQRRTAIVSQIVNDLKRLPAPRKVDRISLFRPALILHGHLPDRRYDL